MIICNKITNFLINKNIISINDVNKLITPLLDSYFHNEEIPLENIINTFLTFAKQCNLTDTMS